MKHERTSSPHPRLPAVVGLVALILAAWGTTAEASMFYSFYDSVKGSDVVARVKGLSAGSDWAMFKIEKVYKGEDFLTNAPNAEIKIIEITPPRRPAWPGDPHFRLQRTNEVTVVFLKRAALRALAFHPHEYGKLWDFEGMSPEAQQAVEEQVQIVLLPDLKAAFEKMLPFAANRDANIRSYARDSLFVLARDCKDQQAIQAHAVQLLSQQNPDLASLGLTLLQDRRVPEAIPRLIEMSKTTNANVAARVSLALRHYKQADVEAVLIGLTRHADGHVRAQTIVNLRDFSSPAVDEAIQARFSDPSDEARAMAIRFSRAPAVAARQGLLETLTKPGGFESKGAAAKALADSGEPEVLQVIISEVPRYPNEKRYRFLLLMALEPKLRGKQELIRKNERVFIEALGDGGTTTHFALGILAESDTPAAWEAIQAVQRDAKDPSNRGTAGWLLENRKKATP
jgi:hypothetical protein